MYNINTITYKMNYINFKINYITFKITILDKDTPFSTLNNAQLQNIEDLVASHAAGLMSGEALHI